MTQPSLEELRGLLRQRPQSRSAFEALRISSERAPLPLDPWARSLLLCLARHLRRQAWLGEVVRDRLGADLSKIGRWGGFEHPQNLPDDHVPGLPDWSFRFHGVGCCLTHADGTSLDVDFVDGGTGWIDLYFYQEFLQTSPALEPPEARLRSDEPTAGHWMVDVDPLVSIGLVEGKSRVRLTDAGHALALVLADAALALDGEENVWTKAWIAWAINDAQLALNALVEAPSTLVSEAAQQAELRIDVLTKMLAQPSINQRAALKALARFGRTISETTTLQQLRREPIDGLTSVALRIVESWADGSHVSAHLDLIARATGRDAPAPYIRRTAIAMVLKHTRPATVEPAVLQVVRDGLQDASAAGDAESALILTLLSPDSGLEALTDALESPITHTRMVAAASLGILGSPTALAILRRMEVSEAQTVLSIVRGLETPPLPEPKSELIMWRGQPRKVFRISDIGVQGWAAPMMADLNQRYEALRRIWHVD